MGKLLKLLRGGEGLMYPQQFTPKSRLQNEEQIALSQFVPHDSPDICFLICADGTDDL